jgi:hypothetical protein
MLCGVLDRSLAATERDALPPPLPPPLLLSQSRAPSQLDLRTDVPLALQQPLGLEGGGAYFGRLV